MEKIVKIVNFWGGGSGGGSRLTSLPYALGSPAEWRVALANSCWSAR